MRVVFDTNIFVSAFVIPGSVAEKAILKIVDGKDVLLLFRDILEVLPIQILEAAAANLEVALTPNEIGIEEFLEENSVLQVAAKDISV
jgi:predicted nucleic acid-binding protein